MIKKIFFTFVVVSFLIFNISCNSDKIDTQVDGSGKSIVLPIILFDNNSKELIFNESTKKGSEHGINFVLLADNKKSYDIPINNGFYLYPAKLKINISDIKDKVNKITVHYDDNCGKNCTKASLDNGVTMSNPKHSIDSVFVFNNINGATNLILESLEGLIQKVVIE